MLNSRQTGRSFERTPFTRSHYLTLLLSNVVLTDFLNQTCGKEMNRCIES